MVWFAMRSPRHHTHSPCGPVVCAVPIALGLVLTSCTLAPTVNVPTDELKDAAADLSAGVKGGAREFGTGLAAGSERYREEIQTAAQGVSKIAKSADDLVTIAKDSPVAFGDAVAHGVLQDESIQKTLKSLTGLARSGDRFVAAAEQGPALLAAKIGEIQAEWTKPDGFVAQQRDVVLGELRKERAAITEAISQERAAAMKDLDAYTVTVIREVSTQLRTLVGSALLLIILLVLVLWGLPFGAGFLVGRLTRRKS